MSFATTPSIISIPKTANAKVNVLTPLHNIDPYASCSLILLESHPLKSVQCFPFFMQLVSR